ncbi:response regulator transcription factor [Salinicoccus sp. YB14-2]|uniref:response regulator transcription factor n=1 Tax=Salinicoccus sp. YB14-2 TaxID=1572701 RepID=UPI00068996B8|nr:response regulator transcription factor [Salinicoccus sp. YB14-2]
MKIFIVEDDSIISEKIKIYVEKWGYEAAIVQNFQSVFSEMIEFDPQLVLMDISLPFFNGYYWCEEIRQVSNVPIIFISSASDNLNIIRAIEKGADDYIAKPFSLEVLLAKVQAILRRTYDFTESNHIIEYRGLIFNVDNFTISFDDKTEELTKNEAKIFQKLFENRGKIIKREKLMMYLWESDSFVDDSVLYTNINRLRKKLTQMGLDNFIITKKGEGYMIGG